MRISGARLAAVGSALMAAGLLVSCSAAPARPHATGAHTRASASARPWWYQGSVDPCMAPALVRARGHVMGAGTCMGLLSKPPLKLTVRVGQRIDVHLTGAGSVRLPHSSIPAVLAPGAASQDRATQTYRAASPGHAALISRARGCFATRHPELRMVTRSCPVVAVTVVP